MMAVVIPEGGGLLAPELPHSSDALVATCCKGCGLQDLSIIYLSIYLFITYLSCKATYIKDT